MHGINVAEVSIRIRRNRFVSGLRGTDKLLPIHLWDRLLYQAHIALNIIRLSRLNPKISAHAIVEGILWLQQNTFGTTSHHEKYNRRCIWVHHGVQVWHIEPSVEHYWCYKVYIYNTRAELITDTVELFPVNTMMKGISSADAATHASIYLIGALKDPTQAALFAPLGIKKLDSLRKLADIFQRQITEKTELETT